MDNVPRPAPPSASVTSPLKLLDASEWAHRPIPNPEWLFEDLLARGEAGLIAGRSNCGKGMLSMEMAACTATGRALFGRKGDGISRFVLVIQMEDSPEELERRFVRLLNLMRTEPDWREEEEALLRDRILFFVPDWNSDCSKSMLGLLPMLETKIKAIQADSHEVGLIILDTLAALTEGDENSVEAQRAIWPSCFRLRDVSHSAVLVIHHLRKTPGNSKAAHISERLSFDALRGSSAITAGARAILQLEPLTSAEANKLGLDEEKAARGGYTVLGATKVVSGPKGGMLLLEQQEGDCGGFWAVHPNTDSLCARLQSRAAADRLSQDEEVLLSIADGVVGRATLCQKHWPQVAPLEAAAKLKAVLNHLRNRHHWVEAGTSMALSDLGRAKVAQLKGLGSQPGNHEKEEIENVVDFH